MAEDPCLNPALFDQNHTPVLLVDPETGGILKANPAARDFYGFGEGQIKKLGLDKLYSADGPKIIRILDRARKDGRLHGLSRLHLPDGSLRDVELLGGPVQAGSRCLMMVIAHDITKRLQSQDAKALYLERQQYLRQIERVIMDLRSAPEICRVLLLHLPKLIRCRHASVVSINRSRGQCTFLGETGDSLTGISPGTNFALDFLGVQEKDLQSPGRIIGLLSSHTSPCKLENLIQSAGAGVVKKFPAAAQDEPVGLLAMGFSKSEEPDALGTETAVEIAAILGMALYSKSLVRELSQQGERIRSLALRLERATESQRRRLARELHDGVGQSMTALSFNLSLIRDMLPEDAGDKRVITLDSAMDLLEETMGNVRRLMTQLQPPVLDQYGIAAALRWHCQELDKRSETRLVFSGEDMQPRLPLEKETVLFRIAQEAVRNAMRHSRANRIEVGIQSSEKAFCLYVSDDGRGIDPLIIEEPREEQGWGLMSMREQAAGLGGTLKIQSDSNSGTRISLHCGR